MPKARTPIETGAPPGALVRIYLDESNTSISSHGHGWRVMLVLSRGRKWVHLIAPSNCETIKINCAKFDLGSWTGMKLRKGIILRQLRDNAKLFDAQKRAVTDAIRLVKAQRTR